MPKHPMRRTAAWIVMVTGLGLRHVPALASPWPGHGAATITGSYADSCRDFTARSSKDISFVELHYADGRVSRRTCIHRRLWSIDGGAGDELDFTRVKAGTTLEEFACEAGAVPPTAVLEIRTPPVEGTIDTCYEFFSGGLACEQSSPRTAWTRATQVPDEGGSESGLFHWGCGALGAPSECVPTIVFRGTGSTDPDGDIASWTLDFGDGTTASGAWAVPPVEIAHLYAPGACQSVVNGSANVCLVTLTVTDSAGQSATDTLRMVFVDQTPD